MKYPALLVLPLLSALTVACGRVTQADPPKPAAPPFEQSAYLWTQATDTDLGGTGDWGMYKSWLNVSRLGAETDPGGWGSWADTTEGNYNYHWGDQQTRHGAAALPDILLGIGSMPYDPVQSDSWNQKLAWAGKTWQLEADNDPATMQHFVTLGNNIAQWNFKSVIIRMDYEFDGGWDPYGNLNVMPNMPGNFIKAWQNVVTTVRNTVKAKNPSIKVKFLWNPTDSNVQVEAAKFYPGDAYVDYIGFDNYDYDYSGVYKSGVQPDAATQQAAWTKSVGPRVQWFADFASAANASPGNPKSRNGYVAGRSVPLIVGEWGLWQVDPKGRPAGGDDPTYIQSMYDWMTTHNVYMECYFETPADGVSTLWPGGYPAPGGNPSWGTRGTSYPKAAAKYLGLFGKAHPPSVPTVPTKPSAMAGIGKVLLTWQRSGGTPSPSYSVYRGLSADGMAVKPIVTDVKATSYLDSGLRDGTTYFYKVKAVNSVGASAPTGPASAVAGVPANYLLNGGFESGDTALWTVKVGDNPQASYVEKRDAGVAHSGSYQYTHWATSPYDLTLSQTASLPNGPHTVSAWVKSSGGQAVCRMEVTANGVKTVVPIAASPNWTQISTPVNVTTGSLTVGFTSKASENQWINLDDVVVK